MSNKFEQLLELLINEENDKAESLFHEIVVEKSRDIYEGLAETEESKDETVEETKEEEVSKVVPAGSHKMPDGTIMKDKDHKKEAKEDETVGEQVELADEAKDETVEEESIEEVGGDATDELIKDISAEEEGEADVADAGEEEVAGDEEGDVEDRVVDLEDALDELKAEFEKMMSGDKGEEEMIPGEEEAEEAALAPVEAQMPFEAKETVKEYKIPKSAETADGTANKKSPTSDKGGKVAKADAKNIAQGSADEKGGTVATPAKIIGDVANTGGKEKVSLKPAPKTETADKADNKKSPVA